MSLESLRDRLAEADEELVRLAAKRVQVARDIAHAKADAGLPTIDFLQERRVLDHARAVACGHGLDPQVAETIIATLIDANVARQEKHRLRLAAAGTGRTAVVVGGAGRMGRWCMDFLALHGYEVQCHDIAGEQADVHDADLVLVAVPPTAVAALYASWCDAPPRGIVVDVASIKAPFVEALRNLQNAGARVGSFHPLFGPATTSLRGAHVALCATGDDGAESMLEALFADTCATVHHMDIDAHDRRMADLLARSHAAALAYAASRPGRDDGLHSSTEARLAAIATEVAEESPEVYYEIQGLNPYAPAAVARLRGALEELEQCVADGPVGFKAWMERAREAA